MRVLIVGCGYVGLPLGAELVRLGHEVFGLRRSTTAAAEFAAAGIQLLTADISKPEDLAALPLPFDWVVNTVSSGHGGPEEYRRSYLEGMRNLIAWLTANPPKKFVYTSSTSVYAQDDGSLIKENSPTTPTAETSQILLEAEQCLLNAATQQKFPGLVLRLAGIYGPDRGHAFQQFLRGEAKIAGKGLRHLNMIHRDDVVGSILAALKNGRAGEVYNVVDDEPVQQVHFYRWLSETLGKWMPPFSEEEESASRKRGVTNKKVSNRKLKMELGYQFKHPTFRQGYTTEITRLDRAGLLTIAKDER